MSYLGLDLGGSKCRYAWWQGAHAGGEAATVHPAVDGDAVPVRLAALLREVAEPAPAACVVAMAGVDRQAQAELVRQLPDHGVDFPVAVVGDVVAAAAAGLRDDAALLLWSGTGSFAIARGDGGELARVGGRGFAFSDEGSGYDLVRRAIVAVLRAADGRGPATALSESLVRAFDAPAAERLGAVAQRLPPKEVAARLPVVLDAFAADDATAADVLLHGLRQLVDLGVAALRRVGREPAPGLAVALGGGVFEHSEVARDGLTRLLQGAFGGALTIRTLVPADAANGAAWLAHGWHNRLEPQRRWVTHVAL